MIRIYLTIISIFFAQHLLAQHTIKGKIINADDRSPIAGASIYINNSSLGTSSNKEGLFTIHSPTRNVELVVSNMGFEKRALEIQIPLQQDLIIAIKEKSTAIEEVVVTNYLKDGWKEWGQFFTDNLIGQGGFADDCKILNHEVVKFRFDKKANVLTAICTEPLKIRNDALGYELTYDLGGFRMDFGSKMFLFEGYAFFKDIGKGRSKYKKNRNTSYLLSLNRFVRSTYNKEWEKDGYIVRKLVKKDNEVRIEAVQKYNAILDSVQKKYRGNWKLFYASQTDFTEDQVNTIRKQRIQPEKISYLMGIMQPDEIIVGEDKEKGLMKLNYTDYLYIIYPADFSKSKNKILQKAASEVSELFIMDSDGIIIEPQGSYFPTASWILSGYAVSYSKLAYMLPLDYVSTE